MVLDLFFTLYSVSHYQSNGFLTSINQNISGYYQYPECFEFLFSDIALKYFDPENAKDCKLCNYTSNNEISDSTKKDLIITFCTLKTLNVALFQRTLRTTRSNASLVVLFDNVALNSMDKVTLEFFKNCSTQIIMIPQFPFPARGAEIKNFLMPLMYTFLMVNRHLINRVIFADIFDCLFQRDPFSSEFIKKGEIHLVRELFTNENHLGKLNWPRCYFHDFKWVRSYDFQINSGYFAGYIDEFLIFMNVFCKYTKYNRCMDQGIVNIIYQLNMLDPYGVIKCHYTDLIGDFHMYKEIIWRM